VLQTGEPVIEGEVEAETPAHPGESRHYMHNYYPDKSKDGTVVGVSCVVQDITERIELETGSPPDQRP
jgi:PAS domain-containing protein